MTMVIVKDIAAAIGLVLSVISLLTFCTKSGRALISSIITKNTKDIVDTNQRQNKDIELIKEILNIIQFELSGVREISIQQCRNYIKNIYYRYCEVKQIPLFERKSVDYTYDIYKNYFNGNSYAALLYNEICKWEVVTTSNDKFEEE